MTKKVLISSAIAAAFITTASLSSAHAAGWGSDKNGNSYGGTPTQESTPSNNTRPRPRPSTQTGGYGGDSDNTRPQRPPSGTYGSNTYPSRDTDTYQPRRYPGPYFPKRDYGDRPYNDGSGPVIYRPSRDTGTYGGTYNRDTGPYGGTYNRGTGPYGGTYNRDQSMPSRPARPSTSSSSTTSGDWNKSGGYGGKP